MERPEYLDELRTAIAELSTVITALGNRIIFSDMTEDACITLLGILERLKAVYRDGLKNLRK